MAWRDYSEDDDYYSQGFEKRGVVSIWLGLTATATSKDTDTLQDLCGVGYYRLSDQERLSHEGEVTELVTLIDGLSYAASFRTEVLEAAKERGVAQVRSVVAQFDFEYDPKRVVREIASDPIFLGGFAYSISTL